MRVIGLDIGTTSISAVVAEDGRVIHSVTEQSRAAISSDFSENRLQGAEIITEKVLKIKERLNVGLFNLSKDKIKNPTVTADKPYTELDCFNCTGGINGREIKLNTELQPYSYLFFTLA